MWYEVTGSSYVTQVVPITSAVGAAAYLAKYIGKTMYEFAVLDKLGFGRRWSKSNNWPGCKRVRLRGTLEKKWTRHAWTPGVLDATDKKASEERNSRAYYMERVGDEKSLLMEKTLMRRRLKGRVEGLAAKLFQDGVGDSVSGR